MGIAVQEGVGIDNEAEEVFHEIIPKNSEYPIQRKVTL